jgi:uncharacterized Rmd1/YagE family protein
MEAKQVKKLAAAIVRAHKNTKLAEGEVEIHRFDFHADMTFPIKAKVQRDRLNKLLDQLETRLEYDTRA